MQVQLGDIAAARNAGEEHNRAAETVFASRKVHKPGLKLKRRQRYRAKSQKLAIALDVQLRAAGTGGWQSLYVDDERRERGDDPEAWKAGTVVSDKGSDCLCLRNFLVHELRLNLMWDFDPCHGAHHSGQHALSRAGLRVHSYLMMFSYNIGLGEWKDGARREQVLASMQDSLAACGGPAGDAVFRACLPAFRETASDDAGQWSVDDEIRLYDKLRNDSCWLQADTRLTNNKFFGSLQRFRHREAAMFFL